MKKTIMTAAIAMMAALTMQAQDSKIIAGVSGSLPMGDLADVSSFGIGVDAAIVSDVVLDGIEIGIGVGYTNYLGKEETTDVGIGTVTTSYDDLQLLPAVGKFAIMLGDSGLGIGADVGYAFALNDGVDGGLTYKPQVIFDANLVRFSLGYQAYRINGDDINAVQLLAAFKF